MTHNATNQHLSIESAPLSPSQRNKYDRTSLHETDLSSALEELEATTERESTEKRVRRIENARAYTQGVQAYREATVVEEPAAIREGELPQSRVFVKARPLFEHETARGEWDCISGLRQGVAVHEGCEKVQFGRGRVKMLQHHEFAEVSRIDTDRGLCSQLNYLVQHACAGGMATLFMYGMTGSGKTYSTNLLHESAPLELMQGGNTVELIAYELVGKKCFDLLAAQKNEVYLRVGEDGATHIQGSTVYTVESAPELQSLLQQSGERRETAATGTNSTSSRSHAVYQLSITGGGTLTMIDLAGNEGNIETFSHTKEQMKEAAEINKSLMVLKTCLEARAAGKAHIPYRESLLTRVLRDALTNEASCTAVVCCVSPACSHLERSLNTLKSAVNLTGRPNTQAPVQQVIQEKGVVKAGPTGWDAEALASWVLSQKFGGKVSLPKGLNGQRIMKLTAVRLAAFCGDDRAVSKQLFDALRVAAKEASQADRALRRELKTGVKPGSCMQFSKKAPSRPIAV